MLDTRQPEAIHMMLELKIEAHTIIANHQNEKEEEDVTSQTWFEQRHI